MSPNVVLFEGADSNGRTELWETNGTAAGTFGTDRRRRGA